MAIYNEILAARYARMLQKVFGIKGPVPTKQLAGEIMTVFPLFSGREMRYLEGWESFWTSNQQTGAAGNNSAQRLRNPATSNVITVIERILMYASVADTALRIARSTTNADLTTLQSMTGTRMDQRGRPQPVCIASAQTAAAVLTPNLLLSVSANVTVDVILTDVQEILLSPGDAVDLITGQLNSTLTVGWIWRERALEDSELK